MNTSKYIVFVFLLCVLAGGLVALHWIDIRGGAGDGSETPARQETVSASEPEDTAEASVPAAPPALEGFSSWPFEKQAETAEALWTVKDLGRDEVEFIRHTILNTELEPVIRNNLAEALVRQEPPDPDLARFFIDIYDNERDTAVFREYAVQFIGASIPFAKDRDAAVAKLYDIAENDPAYFAGTAIVQLVRLEQDGILKLAPPFLDVMSGRLADPDLGPRSQMVLLGVIGARGDAAQIDQVRRIAREPETDSVLRIALATLGLIGDESDVDMAASYLEHENRAVTMAAEAALKRLAPDKTEPRKTPTQ